MPNLKWADLSRMRREVDALLLLSQKKHLGRSKESELQRLLSQYRSARATLTKIERQLDDAELSEIRASKRAQTAEERKKHLDEVDRVRREKRRLHGES
jgi:hypothetical protein